MLKQSVWEGFFNILSALEKKLIEIYFLYDSLKTLSSYGNLHLSQVVFFF